MFVLITDFIFLTNFLFLSTTLTLDFAYQTEHCGWGVVAAESINKGDFVIEYVGEGNSCMSKYKSYVLLLEYSVFISNSNSVL